MRQRQKVSWFSTAAFCIHNSEYRTEQAKDALSTTACYELAMASAELEQLGKRLRQARLKRELTMAELMNKSKVAASAISTIERGGQSPTTETVTRLAKALHVDPCWLAYGTGKKPDWTGKEE